MDIMYPLGGKSKWGDDWELRYSLRSLKFVKHDKVFIVGRKPDWIKNALCIPLNIKYACNKDANMIQKIIYACTLDISEQFIRMSDDQYFLKPYKEEFYSNGILKSGESQWSKLAFNTMDLLKSEGSPIRNYDTHAPCMVSKILYPKIMLQCPYGEGVGVLVNSYYFNHIGVDPKPVNMLRVKSPQESYDFDTDFLNHNDEGLTNNLKAEIEKLFPRKSRYEL